MIAIVKGCGANIASVQFALERLGKKFILTNDINQIRSATHVILPGVGTADQAMKQLQSFQLVDAIRQLTQPVLGICLGMQILFSFSDEGNTNCLNIFPGEIKHLSQAEGISIPHMGWNQLEIIQNSSPLVKNIEDGSYVYYVHSYVAPLDSYSIAVTRHGKTFAAIVENNNFYGVQFHPERSGKVGEMILKNFLDLK